MGAPRESGYYRQTLIWSRPGLPSNFRALTRPLTRLSVNAPKRRDAFSTPAFYRHEELHGLRVCTYGPTGASPDEVSLSKSSQPLRTRNTRYQSTFVLAKVNRAVERRVLNVKDSRNAGVGVF